MSQFVTASSWDTIEASPNTGDIRTPSLRRFQSDASGSPMILTELPHSFLAGQWEFQTSTSMQR